METRLLGLSFTLVLGLALTLMWLAHREHYKSRSWQLLAGRVEALEKIVTGDHTL